MPQFPAQFVADWDKIKKSTVANAANMKVAGMITAGTKAETKTALDKLMKTFDKDLKGKMKTLAGAKDGDVVKAASAVGATAELYLERLAKVRAGAGAKVAPGTFEGVEKKLREIVKAANGLRTGRPQVTVPKDFVAKYEAGMANALKMVDKCQLDDEQKRAVRVSAKKLVDTIHLKVGPKANALQASKDSAAAKVAADALVANTEMGRKLAIDWFKTVPRGAQPIYQAIDFVMTKSATAARQAAAGG